MVEETCIEGTLILIGGNEDKGDGGIENNGFDFIEEGILAHVVKESGGNKAKILVIPTASRVPARVGENYLNAFTKLGCDNVEVLDLREKKQAEQPSFLEAVNQADCVMFSGQMGESFR